MKFLCDTNIISELARPQPNSGVLNQIHQLTLVTRNIRDFEDCDILLLNPFT